MDQRGRSRTSPSRCKPPRHTTNPLPPFLTPSTHPAQPPYSLLSPKAAHQKDPSPSLPIQVQSYFGADDDTGIDDTIDLGDFSAYADALTAAHAVQHHQEQEQLRKASGLDGREDTPDGKRGRGRPKGSKNKPGHRAGRPRKSLLSENGEEMCVSCLLASPPIPSLTRFPRRRRSPKPKRARTINSLPVHHTDHSHSLSHDDDSHQSSSLSSFAMGLTDNPYQHLLAAQPHALQQPHHLQHQHHQQHNQHHQHHAGDIPVDPSLMPAQRHLSHTHTHNGSNDNTSLERLSAELFGSASASPNPSRSNQPTPSTSSATPSSQAQAQADAAMAYFTRQNIVPGPSSGIGSSSGMGEVDSDTVAAIQSRLNDATLQSLAALVPNAHVNVARTSTAPISTAAIMKTISDLMPGKPTILGPLELISVPDLSADGDGTTKHMLESLDQDLVEKGDKGIYVFVANYQGGLDALKEGIALAKKKVVGLSSAGGKSGGKGANGTRDKGKGVAGRKPTSTASPLRAAIASAEQSKSPASDPIASSSTQSSKQASRGPRKCGHCGEYECKGRGGRTYCQKFLDGEPSVVTGPRKHRKSIPPSHVMEQLEAKKKGKVEEKRLSEGFGSRRKEGAAAEVDELDVVVGEQDQGRGRGEGSDEGDGNGEGDDQEDSVQALIQSLHASTSASTSGAAVNTESNDPTPTSNNGSSKASSSTNGTQQYVDPGAPTPVFAPGAGLYAGGKQGESSKASGSGGKRVSKHCALCGDADCPGRLSRTKCRNYGEE